jgi:hypothetical protein
MAAVALCSVTVATTPAAALQMVGNQFIVDFEEFAPGVTGIYYSAPDTHIAGGTVMPGGGAASNVYVGTSISTWQGDGGIDLWWFLGARVSPGASPVTVTFYGFDPDDQGLHVLSTAQTSGAEPDQFLSYEIFTPNAPWLISMSFTSAATFAVDDMTFNLPDSPISVPEPATWTVLLLGFLSLGSVLRRRRGVLFGVGAETVRHP